MGYEVQIAALRADATIWEDTAKVLSSAATTAAGARVPANAVSIVGQLADFDTVANELVDLAAQILRQGDNATTKMATTLRSVARQYETDDAAAQASIGAEWTPIS